MEVNSKELATAIKKVSPAINRDESRASYLGLHFRCSGEGVCAISASDGYRVHTEFVSFKGGINVEFSVELFEIPKSSATTEITYADSGELQVDFLNGSILKLTEIKEKFVGIEKYLPKDNPIFQIGIKASLLKSTLASYGANDILIFDFHGRLAPIMIRKNTYDKGESCTKSESYRLLLPFNI